jgi:hypothetical protein
MKGSFFRKNVTGKVAQATLRGFEPLISTVTGWHVKPLHHRAAAGDTLAGSAYSVKCRQDHVSYLTDNNVLPEIVVP